jgi:hypothetical protein
MSDVFAIKSFFEGAKVRDRRLRLAIWHLPFFWDYKQLMNIFLLPGNYAGKGAFLLSEAKSRKAGRRSIHRSIFQWSKQTLESYFIYLQ